MGFAEAEAHFSEVRTRGYAFYYRDSDMVGRVFE